MDLKKILGLSLFISIVSFIFSKKKAHKSYRPFYTHQSSSRDYIDINEAQGKVDFTHPNERHEETIRSPDGSA